MSTVVGTLQVDVTTGKSTLSFTNEKGELKSLATTAQETSHKLDYSLREASESAILTGEVFGVHLPAGITRVLAELGPLGSAMAAALPVAAVVAGATLIVEHYEKVAAAIRKAADESVNSAVKNADETKSIELTNLKLDDQIAKLEHKPARNYMAEAVLETSKDIDALAAKYATDFQKMNAIIEGHLGFWTRLGRGIADAFSGQGQAHGYGAETDKLWDLRKAAAAAEEARQKLAEAPVDSKSQADAQNEYRDALVKQGTVLQALIGWQKKGSEEYLQLSTQAANTAEAIRALNLTLDESSKKKNIGGLQQQAEDIKNNLIPLFGQFMQQQVRSGEYTSAAAQEYAQKWQKAFEKQADAGEKATNKLKRVWFELAAEQEKQQDEVGKSALEGQKHISEQMQHAAQQETERNIQNYKDMVAQLQSGFTARSAGLSGLGLTKEVVAQAKQEMIELEAEKKKLEADRAGLSPQDTADADKYTQAINALNQKLAEAEAKIVKLGTSWASYFARMKGETTDLATTIRSSLQNSMTQFEQGFANSVAQTLVMGKSWGREMQQIGAQFLESMISVLVKWLIQSMVTDKLRVASTVSANAAASASSHAADSANRLSAAKAAAAKAMTTVPFPFDLVVAPLVFAAALAFAEGGIVPGSGNTDSVPAMLTPGEGVLSKPMMDSLQSSAGGGDHYHMHYSPTQHIKAWDGASVRGALMEHKQDFIKEAHKEIRRRHK